MSFCKFDNQIQSNKKLKRRLFSVRNAYMLLDFGDWIGESTDQAHPYIQLASIVDPVAAQQDFVQVRLGGNNTISSSQWALLPTSEMQHSPVSAEEKKKAYQELILSRWPYIFVGLSALCHPRHWVSYMEVLLQAQGKERKEEESRGRCCAARH